jgi:hypothetical protein
MVKTVGACKDFLMSCYFSELEPTMLTADHMKTRPLWLQVIQAIIPTMRFEAR